MNVSKINTTDEDKFIKEINSLIIASNQSTDMIDPITKITDNIFLGQGRMTLYSGILSQLDIHNIMSIGRPPHFSIKNSGFEHLEISKFEDNLKTNIIQYFPLFFDNMKKIREKNERVFIHCEVGISRSPTVAIAILRHFEYTKTLQEAYNMIKSKRPWICPNHNFHEQLVLFFKEPLNSFKVIQVK